jgi:hypothetical protein
LILQFKSKNLADYYKLGTNESSFLFVIIFVCFLCPAGVARLEANDP